MDFVETNGKAIALKGDWTVENAAAIEHAIAKVDGSPASLDAAQVDRIDSAGAWLIRKHFPGADITNLDQRQKALMDFIPAEQQALPPVKTLPFGTATLTQVGKRVVGGFKYLHAILVFMGEVFGRMGKDILQPSRFRFTAIVRHIDETGVRALPIVAMLALGITMVISYQGAVQLQKFGADIYTIDLTVISLLREMAVLTTAIIVAGRSGSAFAAEIGVMKMRGEVDVMRTLGLDPLETLVVPRLVALIITLPLLAFFAAIVGIAGSCVMSTFQLDLSAGAFLQRVQDTATPTMFFIGIIKAPVFALLITAVCCYQGMSAKGSAEELGKLTTLAVVQSIFLVMMADALFSVVFSKAGL